MKGGPYYIRENIDSHAHHIQDTFAEISSHTVTRFKLSITLTKQRKLFMAKKIINKDFQDE